MNGLVGLAFNENPLTMWRSFERVGLSQSVVTLILIVLILSLPSLVIAVVYWAGNRSHSARINPDRPSLIAIVTWWISLVAQLTGLEKFHGS